MLEIGFDLALARAKELDKYYETHKKLLGPLHGVPVTLKDQFHVKGLDTSMAFVGWIGAFEGKTGTGKERNVESELVRELCSLGAVPIGKVRRLCYRNLWMVLQLTIDPDVSCTESLGVYAPAPVTHPESAQTLTTVPSTPGSRDKQ